MVRIKNLCGLNWAAHSLSRFRLHEQQSKDCQGQVQGLWGTFPLAAHSSLSCTTAVQSLFVVSGLPFCMKLQGGTKPQYQHKNDPQIGHLLAISVLPVQTKQQSRGYKQGTKHWWREVEEHNLAAPTFPLQTLRSAPHCPALPYTTPRYLILLIAFDTQVRMLHSDAVE